MSCDVTVDFVLLSLTQHHPVISGCSKTNWWVRTVTITELSVEWRDSTDTLRIPSVPKQSYRNNWSVNPLLLKSEQLLLHGKHWQKQLCGPNKVDYPSEMIKMWRVYPFFVHACWFVNVYKVKVSLFRLLSQFIFSLEAFTFDLLVLWRSASTEQTSSVNSSDFLPSSQTFLMFFKVVLIKSSAGFLWTSAASNWRKLDQWRPKEEASGLKNHMWTQRWNMFTEMCFSGVPEPKHTESCPSELSEDLNISNIQFFTSSSLSPEGWKDSLNSFIHNINHRWWSGVLFLDHFFCRCENSIFNI